MKLVMFLLLCASITAHAEAQLNTPMNGWNYSGLTDASEQNRVAYPTPPIDRGSQRMRRMIEGHIKDTSSKRMPRLVVNGNPTLVNTDNQGRFARFYAFGSGSNSVELKTDAASQRVQFYETNPNQLTPKLRIVCAWDAPGAEVDMHIITPDGQHAFYAAPVLDGGGGLDTDSVDGPGPEMFTTITPMHGLYHLYINYWGNFSQSSGYNFDESQRDNDVITVRVSIITAENTVDEKRESFVVPLRKIGDLNWVRTIHF